MNFIENLCSGYLDPRMCKASLYVLGQFAIGFASNPLVTIIHESGHAMASYLLFKNSKPSITLKNYGYGEAYCTVNTNRLSKIGEWFGRSNATAIFAAAGPVVQMTASLALMRFFPGNGISTVSLMENAVYAVSSLFEKEFFAERIEDEDEDALSDDFVCVKNYKGGLAASTLIISSVAAAIFGCYMTFHQAIKNAN